MKDVVNELKRVYDAERRLRRRANKLRTRLHRRLLRYLATNPSALVAVREEAEVLQKELAKKLGISQASLSMVEKGDYSRHSPDKLYEILATYAQLETSKWKSF